MKILSGRALDYSDPHICLAKALQIKANELRIDNVFLLEDDTIAIIDYESAYKKENKRLDIIYKYLQELGYTVSDEERELMNGTHLLLQEECVE